MNVFENLVTDERKRDSFIKALFQRYCKEGLVNKDILAILKAKSPSLYDNLGLNGQAIKALPKGWSRAVKSGRR